MKRKEKYGGLMRGRLHIKTTQIPPFFSCIPVFQSFLSLRISLSLANFLTLAKRISRSADHRCICICIFFNFRVYQWCYPSSDSGPSKENFMKRVQIQNNEEAPCQRLWRARKQNKSLLSQRFSLQKRFLS